MLEKFKSLLGIAPQHGERFTGPAEPINHNPHFTARQGQQDDSTRPSAPISRFETTDLQKALDLSG
jgi:hypothetical protein